MRDLTESQRPQQYQIPSAAAATPRRGPTASEALRLRRPTLLRLDTGATRPLGWLLRELTLQAEGLSGALPYFWGYLNK